MEMIVLSHSRWFGIAKHRSVLRQEPKKLYCTYANILDQFSSNEYPNIVQIVCVASLKLMNKFPKTGVAKLYVHWQQYKVTTEPYGY